MKILETDNKIFYHKNTIVHSSAVYSCYHGVTKEMQLKYKWNEIRREITL